MRRWMTRTLVVVVVLVIDSFFASPAAADNCGLTNPSDCFATVTTALATIVGVITFFGIFFFGQLLPKSYTDERSLEDQSRSYWPEGFPINEGELEKRLGDAGITDPHELEVARADWRRTMFQGARVTGRRLGEIVEPAQDLKRRIHLVPGFLALNAIQSFITGRFVGLAGRALGRWLSPIVARLERWGAPKTFVRRLLDLADAPATRRMRARSQELDSHLEPRPDAPNYSRLSQAGGLNATEGTMIVRPNGEVLVPSHVLWSHGPSVPDGTLIRRVTSDGIDRATKFIDRSLMERSIAEAVDSHVPQIEHWLKSNPKIGATLAVDHSPGLGNLGVGFSRGSSGGFEVIENSLESVKVVFKYEGSGRYILHSAFPQP